MCQMVCDHINKEQEIWRHFVGSVQAFQQRNLLILIVNLYKFFIEINAHNLSLAVANMYKEKKSLNYRICSFQIHTNEVNFEIKIKKF